MMLIEWWYSNDGLMMILGLWPEYESIYFHISLTTNHHVSTIFSQAPISNLLIAGIWHVSVNVLDTFYSVKYFFCDKYLMDILMKFWKLFWRKFWRIFWKNFLTNLWRKILTKYWRIIDKYLHAFFFRRYFPDNVLWKLWNLNMTTCNKPNRTKGLC